MKRIKLSIIAILVLLIFCVSACSKSEKTDYTKETTSNELVNIEEDSIETSRSSESTKEPAEIYDLALAAINSGNTLDGIQLMTSIPDYKDTELF